jgi:pilus assembly protein CpaD
MNRCISKPVKSAMKSMLLLGSVLLLAGCTADGFDIEDQYVSQAHYERYPIKVAKAPVRLEVDSARHGLRHDQINSISAFARSAAAASASRIVVSRPSGGGGSRAGAQQIQKLLVDNGVPPGQISQAVYRGSAKSPVMVSYTRAVAVTKECGDWSSDLGTTHTNDPFPNLGCSVQHNIAQMVSDPREFEVPSAPDAVQSQTRTLVKSADDANIRRVFYYFN